MTAAPCPTCSAYRAKIAEARKDGDSRRVIVQVKLWDAHKILQHVAEAMEYIKANYPGGEK